jgi:hypothetical protein
MAALCDLPPEILDIILDLLLTDGNVGFDLRQKLKYRALLPLASCSWYSRRFCVQRGLFWRVDSSFQNPSSVAGQILRNFGPQPVSLLVDLAAPDTWALCGGALKVFPNLEEIGFAHGRRDDYSPIDMDRLSSQLCLSGFHGSRLVLKNAWLSCKDLILFERLEKRLGNITTMSVIQSGLIGQECQLPSRLFGSVLPKLEKVTVCCGNKESAVFEVHGLHRLVELILLSSSISKFEIFSGAPSERSDGKGASSPKIKVDLLKLLRQYTYHSLTAHVDEDGVGTEDYVMEFLRDYTIEESPHQPFERVRFFSFRFEQPEVEKFFVGFFYVALVFFGAKLECILLETTYKKDIDRDGLVNGALEGLQSREYYVHLVPGGKSRNVDVFIGNARDGYSFYRLWLAYPGGARMVQRRHLSASQCKDEIEKYQDGPVGSSIRHSDRLRRQKVIRERLTKMAVT